MSGDGGAMLRGLPLPRLAADELRALAQRIVDADIYIATTPEAIENSFGSLLHLGALRDVDPRTVGALYEETKMASSRSSLGDPSFSSCRLLHADDLPVLAAKLQQIKDALR